MGRRSRAHEACGRKYDERASGGERAPPRDRRSPDWRPTRVPSPSPLHGLVLIWPPLSRFLTVPGGTQYTKVLVLNASYFLHFQWYQIYLTHMYLIGIIGSLVLMCQCTRTLV